MRSRKGVCKKRKTEGKARLKTAIARCRDEGKRDIEEM